MLHTTRMATRWVTQLLRQDDAQVSKKYSQMKLQMQREALIKMNRRANEMSEFATRVPEFANSATGSGTVRGLDTKNRWSSEGQVF